MKLSETGRLLAVVLFLPLPAMAQTDDASAMSHDELSAAFDRQVTHAEQDLGIPRGLSIISGQAASAAQEPAVAVLPPDVSFEDIGEINFRITFDFDSAALRDDQEPKLGTLCQVMRTADISLFRIVGHTDAVGTAEYNERLSQLRAEEVRRHLVDDCGIAAERLQAVGVGEQRLADPQDPGSDENRRVEFQALS